MPSAAVRSHWLSGWGAATGAANLVVSPATLTASAFFEHEAVGTAALTISPATIVGAATFEHTAIATAALDVSPATIAGTATFLYIVTGAADLTVTPATLAAVAAVVNPSFAAAAAFVVSTVTLVGSATYAAGTFTGVAALTISPAVLTAIGTSYIAISVSIDSAILSTANLFYGDAMLDYDGASNGLFVHIGALVKHYNLQRTDGRDLEADVLYILEKFQAGDQDLIVDGLSTQRTTWAGEHVARRSSLVEIATKRLQQREDVLEQIGAVTDAISEILPKLHHQMIMDGETIDRSTATIGGVTSGAAASPNTGTGTVLLCPYLDGLTSPGSSPVGAYPSCLDYAGQLSELVLPSEDLLLICTSDSATDGVAEGNESFSWTGNPEHKLHGLEDNMGSGTIATVNPAQAATLLSNLDFENFTIANTPDEWTIVSGAVTTNIASEAAAANVYHGTKSLKLIGGVTVKLTQAPSGLGSSIQGQRMYCVTARIKSALVAGTLAIKFEGTGYTAAAGTPTAQTIVISGTPTGGTYTLHYDGQSTTALAFNASGATVQAALRLLAGLESVTVATAGTTPNFTHTVTMNGVPRKANAFTSTNALTGGTPVITHAITVTGTRSEQISAAAADLPAAWVLRHFFVLMPDLLPADLTLAISLTGAAGTDIVYVDDLSFSQVKYGAGIGIVLVRGSVPFVREDRFQFTVSNNDAGVFQAFFRDAYGFQLSSSASPTIADALAT